MRYGKPNDWEEWERNFPPGVEIPEPFIHFMEEGHFLYPGELEIRNFYYQIPVMKHILKDKRSVRLVIFGACADGSMYAFWRYDRQPIAQTPIVYWASEQAGSRVIANSFVEFLSLLGSGQFECNRIYQDQAVISELKSQRFCDWLQNDLGVAPVENAEDSIKTAGSNHPNFEQWLLAKMEE